MSYAYDSYGADAPLLLAVALPSTTATATATATAPPLTMEEEKWEDLCRESRGWEFIDGTDATGVNKGVGKGIRNEYGDLKLEGGKVEKGLTPQSQTNPETTGLARLKEALEANEWSIDDEGEQGFEIEGELGGLGLEEEEEDFGVEIRSEGKQVDEEMREPILGRKGDWEDNLPKAALEGGDEEVRELERMMLKMQAVKDMGVDMPEAERKKFAAKAVREIMKTL
ncbi:MAG: hypothetical protein Q9187_002186 [Circinaria calcarea]